MATASAVPVTGTFATLPLGSIRPSPDNPRRQFDAAQLEELAASIRAHGVLEPIIVRALDAEGEGGAPRYEIVAGERRWRAGQAAGLADIPAIVRDLPDETAREIALVENTQRADLDPIAEAEAFDQLVLKHGKNVGEIAAQVGRSRAYVYQRLALTRLPEIARKAVREGRFTAAVGLLVARIPDAKLRVEATRELLKWSALNPTEVAAELQRQYMRPLDKAPFPTGDPELLPEAGVCAACPHRTGNDRDLFGDVKGKDVCADATCYRQKLNAHWQRECARAAEKGHVVADDATSQKLVAFGRVQYGCGYVELDARCSEDPKRRTWRALLGKATPRPTLARDLDSGATHTVVKEAEARAALEEKGYTWAGGSKPKGGRQVAAGSSADETARKAKAALLRRTHERAVAALVEKAEAKPADDGFWRLVLAGLALGSWHDTIASTVARRGWGEKSVRPEESLTKRARGLAGDQLRALTLELLLGRGGYSTWGELAFGKLLVAACEHYDVPLNKLHAATTAEAKARASGASSKKGGEKG